MKNFLILLFSFSFICISWVLNAQTDSITVDPGTVVTPIEQTAVYFYMFIAALIGTLSRAIVSTIKGIKTNPNSPDRFSLIFYAIDNFSQKIKVVLGYLLSFGFIAQFKLAETTYGVILLCVGAAVCGWALDWVAEWIDKFKIKFKPAKA